MVIVRMTRKENLDHFGGPGPFTLDMEEYLCGVVPSEIGDRTHPEALKAQAVAARTYAARLVKDGVTLNDTAAYQAFRASRLESPNSRKAIMDTAGQVLCHEGRIIHCYYSASNGGLTKRSGDVWSRHFPYYVNKPDPWDIAANDEVPTNHSHGIGMSQIGAAWAARDGVLYHDILAFYYDGASIVADYGTGEVLFHEGSEPLLKITRRYMTNNDSYTAGRKIIPTGIMVHSTAAPGVMAAAWFDRWNRSYKKGETSRQVSVHAFLDDQGVWQYLPWNHRGWHAGGTANNFCIGFEICEPAGHSYAGGGTMIGYNPVKQEAYFRAMWRNAIELCAILCTMYKIDPQAIMGHFEGAKQGLASNHADPGHWFKHHDESMDTLRAAVAARLAEGGIVLPAPDPEEQGDPNIPDIPIGTIMAFKPEAQRYYPGGTLIPAWVKDEYYHVVTAVENDAAAVIKGGKPCVLLGKRIRKGRTKDEAGIRTWTDVDMLYKVADPGQTPEEPGDPGEPDPDDPGEPEPGDGFVLYTVKAKDTLWGIARDQLGAGSRYPQIMALNGLSTDKIREGQVLKLPK
ncbi:SpoIID/LytB domain-containing protein [Eubacteriales bacterium OttesenSCG-928-A19]|nr:SpoIID/LytB domain-containing protein [Eubacteriales bacterium OttesenSCG-928-A19]